MTKKICIDRGHGGIDSGAVGYVKERTVAVKVGNYMVDYLKNNFIVDILETKGTDDLNTRCRKSNAWGADLFVSIHFNAGGGDGFEALVYSKENDALANMFWKYVKELGQNAHGNPIKYRPELAVLRLTNCKAILNEIAFVDNKKDIKDWDENAELKKMGIALAKAAAEWLELPKKKKATASKILKVGATIRIKDGAKDLNTGKKFAAFVYENKYTVITITASRVVFGKNGIVTGVVNKNNLTVV